MPAVNNDLIEFDREHLWHPYSAIGSSEPVFPVVSAHGVRLKLNDGRELIDGMASWWCAIHGYNHPVLNAALQAQIEKMSHVMFGGLTHEPAVRLGKKLLGIAPDSLDAIFYADSGSVSVEVALKMAIQYQQALGRFDRSRILTVRGGYHGDTSGAMSVSDPDNGMHHLFKGVLQQQIYAPKPLCRYGGDWDQGDFDAIQALIESHQHEVAAVIIEPVVQGAGGMWFYHPEYLRNLRFVCDQYNIVLIFDEIATGFGRTGELFAMHHANVAPDILCLGKALTGGMMTMAAVLTTQQVARTINQSEAGVFMHGPTFMANPLACAVANASIELLLAADWQRQVKTLERIMLEELSACAEMIGVNDVRVLGAIGVVEMQEPVNRAMLCNAFVEQGVWIRPFNRLIYIMPPYVIAENDLRSLCQAVRQVLGVEQK
ncbi:MAG: adenosylmethionine--8-amino-7-oxononanoate transaminase [Gammaproteobacteria bacterium]|nr:MAG: adenosylmethionine--8-amino-7-oxononanoate transaminase [Gammaproteobacteria bacterium]